MKATTAQWISCGSIFSSGSLISHTSYVHMRFIGMYDPFQDNVLNGPIVAFE